MFDLSLTQQVPPQTLAVPAWREAAKQLAAIISCAFQLEESGDLNKAIETHKTAKDLLESVSKSKGIRKFNRRMYERQADIHLERITYLQHIQQTGGNVIIVPTRNFEPTSATTPPTTPLSSTETKIEEYTLTHSSDLVDVGVRSYWYRLTTSYLPENTLYAIQGITDMDRPLIGTLLLRPNEFFPLGGHLHTSLLIQPDGTFKFRMRRRGQEEGEAVWESPGKETDRKSWSPRTFNFGGRWFVWREEAKSGLLRKWGFEALYETDGEGGAVLGEKLFWGKVGGGMGGKWNFFVREGLSMELKEHCFASQVSRLMRWKYPAQKDLSGVEKGAAAVTAVGALISLGQLLG